jgi:hypothetical protein
MDGITMRIAGGLAVLGRITNNAIYKRLAPGVLPKLNEKVPGDAKRRLKKRLFQALTPDFGHPKLREQLAGTTMLVKYSPNLEIFIERLDREYPQYGKTMNFPFPAKLEALADEVIIN